MFYLVNDCIDLEWAIGLNRYILKIVGLWPQSSTDEYEILLSKFRLLFNVIALIFVLTIPALTALIRVWGDMTLMIDNLQFTLPIMIAIVKVFIMWSKKEALAPLIDMIVEDWLKNKMEKERNIMLRQARITRVLAICGTVMIMIMILFSAISLCFGLSIRHVTNLTDPGKALLMQTHYLYDVAKSPQFELTALAQGITMIINGLVYTAVDSFLGLLVLHICGQMENLHWRLRNLGQDANLQVALKFNVKDHVRLMRSIQSIDDVFNLMLLVILFFFGILFCLHGFLIINVVSQGSQLSLIELCWFLITSGGILLHICLYCAVGELLMTQSEKIHRATYEYEWYTAEPKVIKNLTFIMLRANKPLCITAGRTFPMTMATFCNLLRTSAGYMSVLLANRD